MVTHQSHIGDAPGQTDSSKKLARLHLPLDLTGKRVLDIGCNEGFFTNVAAERGASQVVGIDMDARFLAEAKARYAQDRVIFLEQGWSSLPEGPFDYVLWTSAMHYELDPAEVLRRIANALSPSGTLILECGVHQVPGKEMIYSIRHDGGLWYPSVPFIEEAFSDAGLTYRMVSHAELVGTDPVPRVVYHCTKRIPTVMLISGAPGSGKTNLSHLMKENATKQISLDHFVARIAYAKWHHNDLQKSIARNVDKGNLGKIYHGIDQDGLTNDYISLLAKAVAATDKLVVIEGYMTEIQVETLINQLKGRAKVWMSVQQ